MILIMAVLAAFTSMAATAEIRVEDAWSRATPPGIDRGAGYMTLHNAGDEARTLNGANAEGAGRVEIHESREEDGQMRMEQLPDGVTLEPGETVELAPMGIHLMLMGLDEPLVEGETFPVTLEFRNGETLETELAIRAPDSSADPNNH
ncbi:MAG: copper chaperone PCu(A)C [Pseudomonadota bacterium]